MASNFKDLSGQTFSRLTVTGIAGKDKAGKARYECSCSCGKTKTIRGDHLLKGESQSCGCLQKERVSKANTKHSAVFSPEYKAWAGMFNRCNNPNSRSYHRWGGRGIIVCAQWSDFRVFLKDMGLRPSPKHSIDRINNDGNYEPSNCKWSTQKQQARNKSTNRKVLFHSKEYTSIAELSEVVGIPASTLHNRLKCGWDKYNLGISLVKRRPSIREIHGIAGARSRTV